MRRVFQILEVVANVLSRVAKLAKKYFSFLLFLNSIAFGMTLAVFSRVIVTISRKFNDKRVSHFKRFA